MINLTEYNPPDTLLKHRVILITGASQGLGRSCALSFAAFGATVILHGKDTSKIESVYDDILKNNGPEPYGISLDFNKASENDYATMATEIENNLGRLDGIVHSAVFMTKLSPLNDKNLSSWRATMNVNLIAPATINRACWPLLLDSPDASLIYVSENHSSTSSPYWGQIAASKHALETLAKTQARELRNIPSIRTNIVVPGPIKTASHQTAYPGDLPSRQISPDQIMTPFLFLIGPDSKDVSGEKIYAQTRTSV